MTLIASSFLLCALFVFALASSVDVLHLVFDLTHLTTLFWGLWSIFETTVPDSLCA
jgi:hypothetical protein